MIELVFIVCMSTTPQNCEERSLLYQDVTPAACMMGAQPELAKWTEGHPRWQIASWKCRTFKPGERKV
jgi:hypothetical protein